MAEVSFLSLLWIFPAIIYLKLMEFDRLCNKFTFLISN